jgi:hypothetical protein
VQGDRDHEQPDAAQAGAHRGLATQDEMLVRHVLVDQPQRAAPSRMPHPTASAAGSSPP